MTYEHPLPVQQMLEANATASKDRDLREDTGMSQLRVEGELVHREGREEEVQEQLQLWGLPLSTPEGDGVVQPEEPGKEVEGVRRTERVAEFNTHLGNIFQVYMRADKWDREFGMKAYENYHGKIDDMLFKSGARCSLNRACGIFAALSPNIDEATNFLSLKRLLEGVDLLMSGYPLNIEKAKRILWGMPPLDVLSGNKTRAFYQNIWEPKSVDNPVVVDAHMFSVWHLKRHKVTSIHITDRLYERISKDFKTVAKAVGIRPNQLQAICWSTWKRVNDIVFDGHQPGLEF